MLVGDGLLSWRMNSSRWSITLSLPTYIKYGNRGTANHELFHMGKCQSLLRLPYSLAQHLVSGPNTCSGIDHQLLCPNIHIHVFCIYIIVIEQNHIFIAHFITATKWKSYGERKESPTRSRFSCSLWGGAEPQRQTGSFHSGRRVPDTAPEGSLQKGNDTSKMPVVPLPRICIQMILTIHSRWNATRFRQRMWVTYVQQKLLFFFVVVMIMCDSALLVIVG